MKSQNKRKLYYKNKYWIFDNENFSSILKKYAEDKNKTLTVLEDDLASYLSVSISAIKNWKQGYNSTDISTLEKAAKYLNVETESFLAEFLPKEKNMSINESFILTEKQNDSVKKVYDSIIEFLDEFYKTDGFNDLWYVYKDNGSRHPEDDLYEYAQKCINKVYLCLDKEYFYLHDLKIYDSLEYFIYNDLEETYNGKLEYAYRFEAQVDGNPTTREDYYKALENINSIITNIKIK